MDACGVKTVDELAGMSNKYLVELSNQSGINLRLLTEAREEGKNTLAGSTPYPIPFDHAEGQDNPYLFCYGPEWRKFIEKNPRSGLTLVRCVTDLIKHIDQETAKAFAGTPFANNYFWHMMPCHRYVVQSARSGWRRRATGIIGSLQF